MRLRLRANETGRLYCYRPKRSISSTYNTREAVRRDRLPEVWLSNYPCGTLAESIKPRKRRRRERGRMTPFEFFAAAAWILGGVILLAIAAVIVYGVIVGIRNHNEQQRIKRGAYWKK